jgi:hypothetical protein
MEMHSLSTTSGFLILQSFVKGKKLSFPCFALAAAAAALATSLRSSLLDTIRLAFGDWRVNPCGSYTKGGMSGLEFCRWHASEALLGTLTTASRVLVGLPKALGFGSTLTVL